MARPKKKKCPEDLKREWRETILPADIRDKKASDKFNKYYRRGRATMDLRTTDFKFFTRIAHMQSLFRVVPMDREVWSEGSTHALKRKIRSNTIQRVPNGEIKTQYDKNSIEQVIIEFIFKNKILKSEYAGQDMLKNLWNTFNAAYDYGFCAVKTCFEPDQDGDVRIGYKQIQWNNILPDPDCEHIEASPWYLVRSWVSRSELAQLYDWENNRVKDPTYQEKTLKFLLAHEFEDAKDSRSSQLADQKHAVTTVESIEVRTLYKRGCDEFISFVPIVDGVLRIVKNEDPRKDVPIHFMILEPDPEFPLGMSSILPTLGQQQFADAFQTLSYQTLQLALQPPLMGFGNLTPAKIKMKPRAYWPMGTNPNNKIEKFPVETTTLTQFGNILQAVSGRMQANMNITEQTLATDGQVSGYSGTPQGVEQQKKDKTTTVNQYQQRVEIFFSEWCNHALRSYLHSMGGIQKMTVDEETRRKIWDIEKSQKPKDEEGNMTDDQSIVVGNKIEVDFDQLNSDLLEFEVRTGSLIQSEAEQEIENIQKLLVPTTQMIGNLSDEHKPIFEKNIMALMARISELSNIELAASTGSNINEQLMMDAMKATMDQVMQQQGQINGLQQMMAGQMPQQPGEMPVQQDAGMPQMPPQEPPAMPLEDTGEQPMPMG